MERFDAAPRTGIPSDEEEPTVNRPDGFLRAPGGRRAPLRRAFGPDQVGGAHRPGVIVETGPATAQAGGAWKPRRLPRTPRISATAQGAEMARPDLRSSVEDYYCRVANSLIDQIERGTAPWTEAWKPGEKALRYNIKSGRPYRGGNSVWLGSTASRRL